MAQQPQTNKQIPVVDTTKPNVQPPVLPEVTVTAAETEIKGTEEKIDGKAAEGTLLDNPLEQSAAIDKPEVATGDSDTENAPLEEELILCPDALINKQLVRGLEGIRELFETSQMSNVGPFHVDTYNSLSRALTVLSWEDTKTTLDNLFLYMEKYSEGHCHQNNILQNVTFCKLSKSAQLEYTKLISLFVSLQNPSSRGVTAKAINWNTVPAGFTAAHGNDYTDKFKRYFNIH
jgi:hypothetical protein